MKFTVQNPSTGRRLASYPRDTRREVVAKYVAARRGAGKWAAVPLRQRLACIRRFRRAIIADRERLARILTDEMGKPITQSRNELRGLVERIDFFLAETPRVLAAERVGTGERITHEPLGVVANISAWNYPYYVGGNVFLPALLAGNAVLYKPSEFATGTGLAIAARLHRSGIPRDVFIPVTGDGATGAALVDQEIDGVFFTGSVATGKSIAGRVGSRLIRLQLELGGKDPIYVADDVDIPAAAAALADGVFYNTGQSCCSVERLYVHRKVYAEFLAAFVATVRGFAIGAPRDPATYIGPLARRAQLPVLEAQVADALRKGATLLLGGLRMRGPGNYFEPTVLADVTHSMNVMRDESFGPIIGLMPVPNDSTAVALMNDSSYGLTAGIYTRSRRRAEAVMSQLEAGSVYWNCCDRVSPRLPWTGVKNSGIGVTLSHYGIQAFTRLKAWHLKAM